MQTDRFYGWVKEDLHFISVHDNVDDKIFENFNKLDNFCNDVQSSITDYFH